MAYYNEIPTIEGKIKDLERRMSTSETAPRLTASGVGSGGIKINDGGSLTVEDGGGIYINDGGDILVYGGEMSSFTSNGDGYVRLLNGQLFFRRIPSEQPGRLATDSVEGRTILRLTPPTAQPTPQGADFTTFYLEGRSPAMAGYAILRSEGQIALSSDLTTYLNSKQDIQLNGARNVYVDAKGQMVISSTSELFLDSKKSLITNVTQGSTTTVGGDIQQTAGGQYYLTTGGSLTLRNATADWLLGGTNSYIWNSAEGAVYLNSAGQMTARTPTFYVQGNLGCSGTKPFKIVHPLDETKALVHAATESPVAGLEYWGEDVVGEDGTTVVALPDYYEALAAADWRGVFITPYGEPTLISGSKIVDGKFTVTGTPGTEFSWLAKGRRGDEAGQFEVEPDRVESGIDANLVPDFATMDSIADNVPQPKPEAEPESPVLGVVTPQEPDEEHAPTPDPVDEEETTSD